MDCGYANGKLLAWLAPRNVTFITRLRTNPALQCGAHAWSKRTLETWRQAPSPDGKPREATDERRYRPKKWTRVVRIVAVLVERNHAHGERFHHFFFLASNAARPEATSADRLARYRTRGKAEQRIGEFLRDVAPTVSSVSRARKGAVARKRPTGAAENEVSLRLAGVAYNLLHALRCSLDPAVDERRSTWRLRDRLQRTSAATVTRHARQVTVRIHPAPAPSGGSSSATSPHMSPRRRAPPRSNSGSPPAATPQTSSPRSVARRRFARLLQTPTRMARAHASAVRRRLPGSPLGEGGE